MYIAIDMQARIQVITMHFKSFTYYILYLPFYVCIFLFMYVCDRILENSSKSHIFS